MTEKIIPSGGSVFKDLGLPEPTMVEFVARAQWAARCEYFGEVIKEMPDRQYRLDQARAAIAAMREPTDEMAARGEDEIADEGSAADVWRAMADVAWKESKK